MKTYAIYQNLLAQVERVFRHCRQGSIQTRRRYKEAVCRFCYFLAEVYHVERVANIAPKHIFAYTEFLKENGRAASTIKTDLAAIRFFHDQLPSRKHPKLPTNAMLDLERRSFGKVDRTWHDDEVNRMIGKAWAKAVRTTLPQFSWRGIVACAFMRSSDWTPQPPSVPSKPAS